jgi:DNA-binding winged helix-turn-helix (wHTH) protein
MAPPAAFRFGPFVLDPVTFRLSSVSGDTSLSPKAVDLLLMFVRAPTRLFTKDEIFRLLWPDVTVTDNALTQVISEIRRALGDSPSSSRYLQTRARRGYRFVAPVARVAAGPLNATRSSTPASAPVPARPRRGTPSIRVSDFVNVTGERSLAWLSAGLAETLTSELHALDHLRVIERSASLPTWELMEADLVVVGSYQRMGDALRITSRVVDTATREAIAHAKIDGALCSIFALQDAIASELVAGLRSIEHLTRVRRTRAMSRA